MNIKTRNGFKSKEIKFRLDSRKKDFEGGQALEQVPMEQDFGVAEDVPAHGRFGTE